MGTNLRELTGNLRNMIFMHKLKGIAVLNTVEALSNIPDTGRSALEVDWLYGGSDPVHPGL
jgi:hypothetical protein